MLRNEAIQLRNVRGYHEIGFVLAFSRAAHPVALNTSKKYSRPSAPDNEKKVLSELNTCI